MNSDQLKRFQVIAECGNLTRASEQLYVSQPALSMSLTKLEKELGRQLFVRQGKTMSLTKAGEKLLRYAIVVDEVIESAVRELSVKEENDTLLLYRIGGTAASLLVSGVYNTDNARLRIELVRNREIPSLVDQAERSLLIADNRYLPPLLAQELTCVPLYRQRLLLSVRRDNPLAARASIGITELAQHQLVGRSGHKGFNDWVEDALADNHCTINEAYHSDYTFFATEGEHIPQPFLMSSFGESVAMGQTGFSRRVNLPVTGTYTERQICLWYHPDLATRAQSLIELIQRNADHVTRADRELHREAGNRQTAEG